MGKQAVTETKVKEKKQRVILRLFKDNRKVFPIMFLVSLLALGGVTLSILSPIVLGQATDLISDFVIKGGAFDFGVLNRLLLTLLGIYAASAIVDCLVELSTNNMVTRIITYGFRTRVSKALLRLPVSYIDNTQHGEILTYINNDISSLGGTFGLVIRELVVGSATVIAVLYMLFSINAVLALIVLVLMPVSFVIAGIISSKAEKHFDLFHKQTGKLNSHIEQSYGGHNIIKAYNLENYSTEQFENINQQIKQTAQKGFTISSLIMPLIGFANSLGFVAFCVLGSMFVIEGKITTGQILMVLIYARMFNRPLEGLGNLINNLQRSKVSAKRLYGHYDHKKMSDEPKDSEMFEFSQGVELKDVSFRYAEEVPLIDNLNVKIKKGQKVAIVGPTGCGKTTLVNLLMRFYDVDGGDILIDGKSIYQMSREFNREFYSMVLQDVWLFKGTIKENIRYSRDDATDEEIEEACKNAHADRFIRTLPNGYETQINEDATNISQGQKQLITIARAFLANSPILILDEATSNVDTLTELLVQQAMERLMKDKTSFVIAHRLSTIVDSDLILVMKDGKIIEKGKHNELLEMGGFYNQLYYSQFATQL